MKTRIAALLHMGSSRLHHMVVLQELLEDTTREERLDPAVRTLMLPEIGRGPSCCGVFDILGWLVLLLNMLTLGNKTNPQRKVEFRGGEVEVGWGGRVQKCAFLGFLNTKTCGLVLKHVWCIVSCWHGAA